LDRIADQNTFTMQPIQQLLSRLRWDPRYRNGRFDIGFYDRRARAIIVVPFAALEFPVGERFAFEIMDADGNVHHIPFHRIRRVWRDGRLLWQRNPQAELGTGIRHRPP
jgi:uncharacterized protein (UPF0248 family)